MEERDGLSHITTRKKSRKKYREALISGSQLEVLLNRNILKYKGKDSHRVQIHGTMGDDGTGEGSRSQRRRNSEGDAYGHDRPEGEHLTEVQSENSDVKETSEQ